MQWLEYSGGPFGNAIAGCKVMLGYQARSRNSVRETAIRKEMKQSNHRDVREPNLNSRELQYMSQRALGSLVQNWLEANGHDIDSLVGTKIEIGFRHMPDEAMAPRPMDGGDEGSPGIEIVMEMRPSEG